MDEVKAEIDKLQDENAKLKAKNMRLSELLSRWLCEKTVYMNQLEREEGYGKDMYERKCKAEDRVKRLERLLGLRDD